MDLGFLEGGADGGVEEGGEFLFAGFFEAGAGGTKFIGAVAGMAHEFGEAVGESVDEGDEVGGAEAAGELEAGEVVGGF